VVVAMDGICILSRSATSQQTAHVPRAVRTPVLRARSKSLSINGSRAAHARRNAWSMIRQSMRNVISLPMREQCRPARRGGDAVYAST